MRYATPTRPAHAVIVKPFPRVAGAHRTPARSRTRSHRHLRHEPYRTARQLTRGLAGVIVLGIMVMLGVFIVADARRTAITEPAALTAARIFPDQGSYFRASQARAEADCPVAVTGGLRPVLQGYGCSQALRAVLTVGYADYRITAGVLTLPDAASATAVSDAIREQVETGDGGFAELSGADTPPGTPVAWRTHESHLLYCVIVSPRGVLVPHTDPAVSRITTEILDTHLAATVPVARG